MDSNIALGVSFNKVTTEVAEQIEVETKVLRRLCEAQGESFSTLYAEAYRKSQVSLASFVDCLRVAQQKVARSAV